VLKRLVGSPLWLLYLFIFIGTLLMGMFLLHYEWEQLQSEKYHELKNKNIYEKEIAKITLKNKGGVLYGISRQLLAIDPIQNPQAALAIMEALVANDPEIGGFGLASPEGQLLLVGGVPATRKLPHLFEITKDHALFEKALKSDTFVVGNTFYMPLLGKWVMPIRSAVRNAQGEVLFVIITGIDIAQYQKRHELDSLNLNFTHYYISDTAQIIYKFPTHGKTAQETYVTLDEHILNAVDLSTLTGDTFQMFRIQNDLGQEVLAVLSYLPKFDIYIATSYPVRELRYELLTYGLQNLLLFALFLVALFLAFRLYARKENESKRQLEYRANHDILTGLPNRYSLQRFANQLIQEKQAPQLYLLFMDLDNFKQINDTYGHSFGDELLLQISKRFEHLHTPSSMIARQGGDEFIIVTTLTSVDIDSYCNTILELLQEPFVIDKNMLTVQCSIGVAHYPHDAKEIDALLRYADLALYKAKQNRGRIAFYTPQLDALQQRKHLIESNLRHALAKNELTMLYQPQIESATGRLVGVEALMRWNHSQLGAISPMEFIPIAEESDLILSLGAFALSQACMQIESLWSASNTHFELSVNLSVKQLLAPQFLEQLDALRAQHPQASGRLVLEITESLLIEDLHGALRRLQALRSRNIGIALDDFGTGYSSLSMLHQLPITQLKIDKSFIKTLSTERSDANLVATIITLSKNLAIKTVAEGVEEASHVEKLQAFGCDILQGYYYAKPMSIEALQSYLQKLHL